MMIKKFLVIVFILLLTACHQKNTCNDKCTINHVRNSNIIIQLQ